MTLSQVRETLVSAKAVAFFEAWAAAESTESGARDEAENLLAQALVSEARATAAETALRTTNPRLAPPTDPDADALFRRESEALSQIAGDRAARLQQEANERRQRAAALHTEAETATARLSESQRIKTGLRIDAVTFDAIAGESCLFFADADSPGGAFAVPLSSIAVNGVELPALMLHRLARGAPLEQAVAIRDEAPESVKNSAKSRNKKPRRKEKETS